MLHPRPIEVSAAQLRKLVSGGAITLQPHQFVDMSPHSMMVMPNTARRIATAIKKSKGVRVALKPEEDIVAMEGGSILGSIKKGFDKAGKDIKKGVSKGATVVKKGFNKTIVDSGVGKEIAKNLIDVGANYVLPAVGGVAGEMLGGPLGGIAGATAAGYAGKYIDSAADKAGYGIQGLKKSIRKGARRVGVPVGARLAYDDLEGEGLFQALHKIGAHKIGITKKSVTKAAKETGKVAVRVGAKAAGEAVSAYTGNPAAGMAFEKIAVGAADRAIDSKNAKSILKNAGKGALKEGKMIGVEMVDDYIDKNLTGAERKVAQNALAGRYPDAKSLVYDYSNSKIEELNPPNPFGGYGLPRRTRSGLRMGNGLAHLTPAFDVAMRSATTGAGLGRMSGAMMRRGGMMGCGFRVADDRTITPAEAPSAVIQTGSPFQRIQSPAMSPYIASSPQLANIRIGGSFYPAGMSGGSFDPAGTD